MLVDEAPEGPAVLVAGAGGAGDIASMALQSGMQVGPLETSDHTGFGDAEAFVGRAAEGAPQEYFGRQPVCAPPMAARLGFVGRVQGGIGACGFMRLRDDGVMPTFLG